MGETQAETLERFFRTLTDAMRAARPAGDARPLTVGEIYNDLVPYRVARAAVGFDMNADYEHALMRLLAGEGEYLRLDPEEARRELQRELGSSNPDVTLYRKFAACDVVLGGGAPNGAPAPARTEPARERDTPQRPAADSSAGTRQAAPPSGAALRAGEAAAGAPRRDPARPRQAEPPHHSQPDPPRSAPADPPRPPQEPPRTARQAEAPPPASAGPLACHACGEGLPEGARVRFCPYCGTARRVPCGECGEPLEAAWRFCTACGRRAGSGG